MIFTRNIGRAGRVLRFSAGCLLALSGLVGLVREIPGAGLGWRFLMGGLILAGAFAMLEGLIGWCALRAAGFRIRL